MRLAGLLLALTLLPCPALAEGRIALLIGNQAYTGKVQPLKSPHNDIKTVGKALEADGFKVTLLVDANRRDRSGMAAASGRSRHRLFRPHHGPR